VGSFYQSTKLRYARLIALGHAAVAAIFAALGNGAAMPPTFSVTSRVARFGHPDFRIRPYRLIALSKRPIASPASPFRTRTSAPAQSSTEDSPLCSNP
jgi:hypothetical protein